MWAASRDAKKEGGSRHPSHDSSEPTPRAGDSPASGNAGKGAADRDPWDYLIGAVVAACISTLVLVGSLVLFVERIPIWPYQSYLAGLAVALFGAACGALAVRFYAKWSLMRGAGTGDANRLDVIGTLAAAIFLATQSYLMARALGQPAAAGTGGMGNSPLGTLLVLGIFTNPPYAFALCWDAAGTRVQRESRGLGSLINLYAALYVTVSLLAGFLLIDSIAGP